MKYMKRFLKAREGFTLIELLAVMAILAIMVAVVAPSVTGTRDASIKAQAQQDAKQVTTSATDFYGKQTEAEVRTPHSTLVGAIGVTTLPTDKATGQQVVSSRWPERYITASTTDPDATDPLDRYAVEFQAAGSVAAPLTSGVTKVTLLDTDNKTLVGTSVLETNATSENRTTSGKAFLSYTAVDLDGLVKGGYLAKAPAASGTTSTVVAPTSGGTTVTVEVHNFLWLFKKASSGAGVDDDIRTITVFQLTATEINEGEGTVSLTYKRVM